MRFWKYGLVNGLLVLFTLALAAGGCWPWLVVAAAFTIGGPIDELVADDRSDVGGGPSWFYYVNLLATLPLTIAMTLFYIRHLMRTGAPGASAEQFVLLDGTIFGCGYFYGLAGIAVGHELIHRTTDRLARTTGQILLAFAFNPTFAIAHIGGHHNNVGKRCDPATSRRGEYALTFVVRCSVGQWIEAFDLEAKRLHKRGHRAMTWRNRAILGHLNLLAILAVVGAASGLRGLLGFVAAGLIGKTLGHLVDYVQHHGLVRVEGSPVEARHSWDTYRMLSNTLQYNLPRHADHHLFAGRPFWQLQENPAAPVLPCGYQTAALLALVPSIWRKIIERPLLEWDRQFASEPERAIILQHGQARRAS
jgi:fatty acid desaturase